MGGAVALLADGVPDVAAEQDTSIARTAALRTPAAALLTTSALIHASCLTASAFANVAIRDVGGNLAACVCDADLGKSVTDL